MTSGDVISKIGVRLNAWARGVVSPGAGISAESGIPTYRGSDNSLWKNFDGNKLATLESFKEDPVGNYQWYRERYALMKHAQPNDAHKMLASWEKKIPELSLVTQNIDGLRQKAGSRKIMEIHGNIHRMKCMDFGHPLVWVAVTAGVPLCATCGPILRPAVVWFGEDLQLTHMKMLNTVLKYCDVFISVGTSAFVEPASVFMELAKLSGAMTVVVNPDAMLIGWKIFI